MPLLDIAPLPPMPQGGELTTILGLIILIIAAAGIIWRLTRHDESDSINDTYTR